MLKAGHCSTNCETVPQKVEQLLLKVACYFKMWNSVPLLIAHHIVVDRHKWLFRIIIMHLVLCKFMAENY